nr:acetyl-CoA C-acetyltransferase [Gammaproteobacteria bacterium]
MSEIIIASAKRTPIGQFNGYFKQMPSTQLGANAIKAVLNDTKIKSENINAVYMGCVLSAGLGQAPARQAALAAGITAATPCTTINKVCGSGMQSIIYAYQAMRSDNLDCVIAGGMENMSMAPYLLKKARSGYRLGHSELYDHMILDGLEDAYSGESMGLFAEKCASKFNLSREQQDEY